MPSIAVTSFNMAMEAYAEPFLVKQQKRLEAIQVHATH